MLVLTVSRRSEETGHTEPVLAISDPAVVHRLLRDVAQLADEDESPMSDRRMHGGAVGREKAVGDE